VKRLLIVAVVGLIAVPAMAQVTPVHLDATNVVVNDNTRDMEPYVYLENTYRNNAGWLSWYPYADLEVVDDIGTIYSQGAKEQAYGQNMYPGGMATFTMTGFDVGWYSLDTNTTHVQVMTVNFYDNPAGADYTGYTVGTTFVPVPPTLLASFTVSAPNAPGANFVDWDFVDDALGPDLVMPSDLWMGVTLGAMPDGSKTGVMLCKDWGGPNPWGWTGGPAGSGNRAEYGHSDWWWAAGWNWSQYYNGPPTPTTGAPYYDAYSPRGSFCYSIRGIPEPATLSLLALSGLAMIRRRR
jgi:hypothetical protein